MEEYAQDKWVWRMKPELYSKEMKNKVIAKLIEILVTVTFETHVYKWAGKLYKQKKGGPIGLRASGTVAKIAMEEWIRGLGMRLEELGFTVHLLRKYVDDVKVIDRNCQLGGKAHQRKDPKDRNVYRGRLTERKNQI